MKRWLSVLAVALATQCISCGGGGSPSGPTAPPAPPAKTNSHFVQPPWDVTVFFGAGGGGLLGGGHAADGDNLTGNFTNSAGGGFNGTLRGVLTGNLDNGTFSGTLLTTTARGCVAERQYFGPLNATSISWTPGDQVNDCGGTTPLVVPVQAAVTTTPPCTFAATVSSESVPAAGGNLNGTITAGGNCSWYSLSTVDWITVTSGAQGTGNGSVGFTASANPSSAARSGVVVLATRSFTINQPGATAACTYNLSTLSANIPNAGGTGSITVTTAAGCAWTAASNANWITVSPASGSGPGTVNFTAAANPEASSRSGTLTIASQTVTITEAGPSCSYTATASTTSVSAAGGTLSVAVTAGAGCTWSASASVPWITLTSGASGTGNGSAAFTVAANPESSQRTGTITVAGQTITISQAGGSCSYTVAPSATSFAAAGGTGTAAVTTTSNCAWTATSGVPWITFGSGSSGTGNGSAAFTVAANPDPSQRTGTLTIAGQTITISQAGGSCAYTVVPSATDFAAAGGTGTAAVTTTSNCAWTATTSVPWITLTSGGSGTGNGTVAFTVAANTGAARSGTLTVAGQTITISQAAAACTYSVSPTTVSVPAAGVTATATVTTGSTCAWTATTPDSWITLAPASGTGNGSVTMTFAANTSGSARTSTVTIGGQAITISQAGTTCTYTVTGAGPYPSGASTQTMSVTAPAGCAWTATHTGGVPWLTITGGSTGSGNGTVTFTLAANSDPSTERSTNLLIAGINRPVVQAGTVPFCSGGSVTATPAAASLPSGASNSTISISSTVRCWYGPTTVDVTWITITGGSQGATPGPITFSVAANTGSTSRTARFTITGASNNPITVTQAGVTPLNLVSSFAPDPVFSSGTQGCGSIGGAGSPTWFFRPTLSTDGPSGGQLVTVSSWGFRFFNASGGPAGSSNATAAEFLSIFGRRDIPAAPVTASGSLCVFLTSGSSGFVELFFDGTDSSGTQRSFTTKRLQLLPQGLVPSPNLERRD